jgi:hypothetical protein
MLNDPTVAMLTDTLVRLEAVAERSGWNKPPVLSGLFTHHSPLMTAVEVEPFPVHPKTWHLPDPDQPGETLPTAVILGTIADYLTRRARPGFARWLRPHRRQFLGVAFTCEAYSTSHYAGYRPGDLNQVPAMADNEVRLVTALDVDGRLYQITRVRGHDKPDVTVLHPAPTGYAETTIGEAMSNLVNLVRQLTGGRRNGAKP